MSIRPASDNVSAPRKLNSLQALTRLRPIRGSEWNVMAFALNRDMIQSDGSLDDLHGMVFLLGSFDTYEDAAEHAKKIIEITGHPAVIPVRYGYPFRLSTTFEPDSVEEVPVGENGELLKLESAQHEREVREYERRAKLERDIVNEMEAEVDPDDIEHFKRQCFMAIKCRSKYHMNSRDADAAWAEYEKHKMKIRDHYGRHPEHEEQWLDHLKQKLEERGEIKLYHAMERAYTDLRDELLGLVESSDEDD